MTFPSAGLKFTPHTAPIVPAQLEPGIVEINGKRYKITVEIQVDGKWEKIDSSKLRSDLQTIAECCHKIYHVTGPANPSSFTVHLGQTEALWSLKGATLGRFAERFKDAPPGAAVIKIEYKTVGSTQTIDLKDYTLQPEVTQQLQEATQAIAQVINTIFTYRDHFVNKKPLPKLETRSSTNAEKLQAVKRSLNVQEAGSQENRCATLSIAAILLKKNNGNLQEAADEFSIPIAPKEGEAPQITLSNGLIELAAQIITTHDLFTEDDHYSSIIAALKDAKQGIVDETNRKAVVNQYAALIREPGQMLDIPVFEALGVHGIPLITLVPSQGDLVLGSISGPIAFDAHNLDTYDLTKICFVVRDGLHYQPVIMSDPSAQQEKLRSILKNNMEQTLGQIQALITDKQKSSLEKSAEFNLLVTSVINKYAFDAKPRIIQMLKSGNRIISDDLKNPVSNEAFIGAANTAFTGLIVEEP